MNTLWQAYLAALALASAACAVLDGHSCSDVGYFCDQTTVLLQSPGNAWAAGTYTLQLNVDGTTTQCTLSLSDPPPTGTQQSVGGSVRGTCSAANTTWTLTQLCPQPAPICNATACGGMVSNANCLPGQYQMSVVVSAQETGTSDFSGIASKVALDLSIDGKTLAKETIVPTASTTEPNGHGCGTCTNASATVAVMGG